VVNRRPLPALPGWGLRLTTGKARPQSLNPLRRTVSSKSASCGPVPRPSRRSPFGPRAQAHHSSVLRMAGSTSWPAHDAHEAPVRRLAAIAVRIAGYVVSSVVIRMTLATGGQ
jgi:hypothetical protein